MFFRLLLTNWLVFSFKVGVIIVLVCLIKKVDIYLIAAGLLLLDHALLDARSSLNLLCRRNIQLVKIWNIALATNRPGLSRIKVKYLFFELAICIWWSLRFIIPISAISFIINSTKSTFISFIGSVILAMSFLDSQEIFACFNRPEGEGLLLRFEVLEADVADRQANCAWLRLFDLNYIFRLGFNLLLGRRKTSC